MARAIREDRNPFTNGLVTDLDPRSLGGGFASKLENIIFTRNVAAKRGMPKNFGSSDPTGSGDAFIAIRSSPRFDDPTERMTIVNQRNAGSAGGNLGLIDGAGAPRDLGSPGWPLGYIRGPWRGEWLIPDRDGEHPIIRITALEKGAQGSNTGTLSVAAGSTTVVGVGTTFTSAKVGQFLAIQHANAYGNVNPFYRVVSIDSDTVLNIEEPVPFTASAAPFIFHQYGYIGVCSQVAGPETGGMATFPAADSSPVTGNGGTRFLSGVPGLFESVFTFRDLIGRADRNSGWTGPTKCDSPTNEETLQITGFTTAASGVKFLQIRPLVGKCVEFHNNRIFAANMRIAPNRLQWTQVGKPFSHHFNGDDAESANYLYARSANFREVPSPNSDGEIVGLISAANGGLVIARSNSMHVLWGEPEEGNVQEISGGASLMDPRALFSSEHGVFSAGRTGIWHWPGAGGFRDITFQKINAEYREWVRDYVVDRDSVVVFEDEEHLVVCGVVNGVAKTWAFWLGRDDLPCTGVYPGLEIFDAHATRFPNRVPETFICRRTGTQAGSLRGVFDDAAQSNQGDFGSGKVIARTGEQIVGEEGDSTRLRRIRVAADVKNAVNETTTLQIKSGATDVTPSVHKAITGNQADGVKVAVARPQTGAGATPGGVLGKRVREGYIELEETGDDPEALRIHSVVADARDKGKRV